MKKSIGIMYINNFNYVLILILAESGLHHIVNSVYTKWSFILHGQIVVKFSSNFIILKQILIYNFNNFSFPNKCIGIHLHQIRF